MGAWSQRIGGDMASAGLRCLSWASSTAEQAGRHHRWLPLAVHTPPAHSPTCRPVLGLGKQDVLWRDKQAGTATWFKVTTS